MEEKIRITPTIKLNESEFDKLKELTNQNKLNPYLNSEDFFFDSAIAFNKFPENLIRQLNHFKWYGNEFGAILVKNMPVDDDLIPTPSSRKKEFKKTFNSEFFLSAVASFLGEPFNFLQEARGKIIQDIHPIKIDEEKQSSYSSSVMLDYHTEIHFHPNHPDYILLFCLRQDPKKEAKTIFTSSSQIIKSLTPYERNILHQKNFYTGIYYQYGDPDGTKGNLVELVPVLYGDQSNPFMIFDSNLIVGKDYESQRVLEKVKKIIETNYDYVLLEPGDLLIIDNKKAIHARSSFTSFFNGKDRWLQRILSTKDLRRASDHLQPNDRLIRVDFANQLERENTEPFDQRKKLLEEWNRDVKQKAQ